MPFQQPSNSIMQEDVLKVHVDVNNIASLAEFCVDLRGPGVCALYTGMDMVTPVIPPECNELGMYKCKVNGKTSNK